MREDRWREVERERWESCGQVKRKRGDEWGHVEREREMSGDRWRERWER